MTHDSVASAGASSALGASGWGASSVLAGSSVEGASGFNHGTSQLKSTVPRDSPYLDLVFLLLLGALGSLCLLVSIFERG